MASIIHSMAVAATALTAMQAHADITLYGRANIDFEKTNLGGTPVADAFGGNQRFSSNSSRFGIRASREFQGLNFFVQVETGLDMDVGGNTLATRDTFVGVEGGFGKARIGKMDTPFKDMGGFTARFAGTGVQDDGSLAGLGGNNGFSRRQNNALRYDTPNFNGLTGSIMYGLQNEDSKSSEQQKIWSLNAIYKISKLQAGLSYERHENFNGNSTDHGWRAGVKYDFGFMNVGADVNQIQYDLPTGSAKRTYASISGSVPIGNGAINVRYGRAGKVSGSAPAGTTVAGGDGARLYVGPDSGAQQWTIGYEYNLFKGAQLYTYWTKISNQANANYRFGVNAMNIAAANPGADPSAFVVGMSYDF